MAKRVDPLHPATVKALAAKGEPWRPADGAGLFLVVTDKGRAWRVLR